MSTTHTSVSRKVTASGVVWLNGRSYYVSRRLAGQVIPLRIVGGRLIIDVAVPLHKVYRLPARNSGDAREATTAPLSPQPEPDSSSSPEPPRRTPCLLNEAGR